MFSMYSIGDGKRKLIYSYKTLESLKSLTFNDLLHIRNMGRRSATEVKTILYEKYGVKIEEGE